MRTTTPILVALVLASALLAAAPPAEAAHAHYLRLLRQGTFALEQDEPGTAAEDLRLACFGFLEEPPLLGECLVRLGLAQDAIDDGEGFGETFRRVVEVEQRFGGFGAAALSAEERAAFESAIVERIPARTLGYSGVFRHLVPREPSRPETEDGEAAPDSTQPPEPESSDGAPPPAASPRTSVPTPTRTSTQTSTQTLTGAPTSTGAGAAPGAGTASGSSSRLSRKDRAALEQVRALLDQADQRSELEEPYRMAREVADANPDSREAQHLAAVIAYRSSRWDDAVRYFQRGGDPGDDRPETLFYLAVAQYESGDAGRARGTLRRSLPHLEKTPFVLRYEEKILGTDRLSTERPEGGDDGTPGQGSERRVSSSQPSLR